MNILEELPGIKKDVLLSDYTTFKIGGPARYFLVAEREEDIVSAIRAARELGLPLFILGGGSNLLVSDKGFDGLVIKPQITNIRFQNNTIIASAGTPLSKLIIESVNNDLTGLEWAMGIPGTVGGAVVGNSGAYGHSTSEAVKTVRVISAEDGSRKEYENSDCCFDYRESRFKDAGEIIIEVVLVLERGDKEQGRQKIKEIVSERSGKHPLQPSAGSVFKNYRVGNNDPLVGQFPALVEKIKGGKLSVGYLIGQCGLNGRQIGGAKISEEHGNFIVNLGGATAEDVVALIKICKDEVKKRYNIALGEEIRYIGF